MKWFMLSFTIFCYFTSGCRAACEEERKRRDLYKAQLEQAAFQAPISTYHVGTTFGGGHSPSSSFGFGPGPLSGGKIPGLDLLKLRYAKAQAAFKRCMKAVEEAAQAERDREIAEAFRPGVERIESPAFEMMIAEIKSDYKKNLKRLIKEYGGDTESEDYKKEKRALKAECEQRVQQAESDFNARVAYFSTPICTTSFDPSKKLVFRRKK